MDPSLYSSLLEHGVPSEDSASDAAPPTQAQQVGSDFRTLCKRFYQVAAPYWYSEDRVQARIRLFVVFSFTLATTAISVGFSFLSRDFYNALANKDANQFEKQLMYYMLAFLAGIPVFVIRDYMRELLSVRWRSWMTSQYINYYFENRTFYNIETQSLIDNPDQRIVHDVGSFTGTALAFALAIFNALIDLVSFSGILYSIYPPLFLVLIAYSLVGTIISVLLGKDLVGLNFIQEKRDADFRYGLVRARDNAESIAFYGGEESETQLLLRCFKQSLDNLYKLLIVSRNLNFFTSAYRYFIQLLPAAVVAPLYFRGDIDFGVINQSFSAFDHILGEFTDVLTRLRCRDEETGLNASAAMAGARPRINRIDISDCSDFDARTMPLISVEHLTLITPQYTITLVQDLTFVLHEGEHLLIMGPSGSGKTSLLRAIAGLWDSGRGTIRTCLRCEGEAELERSRIVVPPKVFGEIEEEPDGEGQPNRGCRSMIFFLPQKPYMVIGSLRQQLLYPTWVKATDSYEEVIRDPTGLPRPPPTDPEILGILGRVKLEHLVPSNEALDSHGEWASTLSQGEQQRIAVARLLICRPRLAIMDESTSAMDEENEANLYHEIEAAGITYISVAHRSCLKRFHSNVLTFYSNRIPGAGCRWTFRCSSDSCSGDSLGP